jgi:hypothetical protein
LKSLTAVIIAGATALASLAGCFSLGRGHGPVEAFQFLESRNPGLESTVTGSMNENTDPVDITAVVPPTLRNLDLVATFSLNTQATISVVSSGRPVPQQNGVSRNDFSAPVLYSVQVPGQAQPWRYRVSVRYAETSAALSRISLADGYALIPRFSPSVKSYTVEVPNAVRKIRIEAEGQSRNLREIAIDGASTAGPVAGATVDFTSGTARVVSIETLAEDGATRDAYTVTLKRLSADSNARLESLEIAGSQLSPAFSPARAGYQVEVPFDTTAIVVKAHPQSGLATIALLTPSVAGRITSGRVTLPARGNPADRAGATVDFTGATQLSVIVAVTAEDGGVQEYLVDVIRAEPDHDNTLADLTVDTGRMNPAFNPRVLTYAVEVPFSTREIGISARAQGGYATVELVPGPSTTATSSVNVRGDVGANGGATVEFSNIGRLSLSVAVTAQDGRVRQYVLDVRRATPDANADLGSLVASTGVMNPLFSPRVVSYTVSLPANVNSVRLTATAASTVAEVTVEESTARPGVAQVVTVAVANGATETVNLVVTAEDGSQKLYRVRVSREAAAPAPRDANTRLAGLRLAGAQLSPTFRADVFNYEARLVADVASVTLTATAESPVATVEVDGQPLGRAGRVIALAPGEVKTVLVDVIAENGVVARTILWLNRDRAARDPNTRLANLRLAGAQLSPAFNPLVLDYVAKLSANVASVTLTAEAESPVATVEVDGQPLGRAGRVIALEPGAERMVIIDVTAANGTVASTSLWLSRERAGGGKDTNARLARLNLVGAQLSPGFDPRVLEYTSRLGADVDSVILTATAESPAAAIVVDGTPLSRSGRVIGLEPGAARTVRIDVTAESGAVARTTLRLSREAANDDNTRLARLQLTGAQLAPNFDARVLEYSARLAVNVASVVLTAAAESPVAAITVDGQPLARTGRVIALEPGAARTVIIDVTAESGAVARTFLRLSREAVLDANARLSRLQLAGAQIAPAFDPRALEYSAKLAANVASVVLTATAESAAATIEVDGQPLARTGRVIALEPGAARTVLIDVTAENGNIARTFLRLSREAAQDANTRLARLQLSGAELAPAFDPRVLEYSAKLAANVASVVLTATAESAAATIEVDGQPLARTGRVIALEPGATKTVIVEVSAGTGDVARTLIRLGRAGGDVPPPVTPGNDRVSVTIGGVKVEQREATGNSVSRGAIGGEAKITVRYYRTNTMIVQGSAEVGVKMQGATAVLTASWTSPGVKLERNRLVEVEVAIPAGGSNWLAYTEAQWADAVVAVDVPFLVLSRTSRVSWPAIGSPVRVAGYIAFSPGGPRKSEVAAGAENLELDARGEYVVEVIIADAATGRVLVQDTVRGKPGFPRSHVYTFSKPVNLPEGATVKYTLTAKAKNGKGWTASGTTEVWTIGLDEKGGFEPVVLQFGEDLRPPK